jgi:hypothetical protein
MIQMHMEERLVWLEDSRTYSTLNHMGALSAFLIDFHMLIVTLLTKGGKKTLTG